MIPVLVVCHIGLLLGMTGSSMNEISCMCMFPMCRRIVVCMRERERGGGGRKRERERERERKREREYVCMHACVCRHYVCNCRHFKTILLK